MTGRRRVLARLLLVTAGVGVAAAVVEFSLRATGFPHGGIEYVPSSVPGYALMGANQELVTTWTTPLDHIRINSLGLRGRELDPDRCWTVLLLGDSFTFQPAYPNALARLIERAYGRGIDVVNAGYVGETIDHQVIVFEEQGLLTRPDVVVLQFFANDIEDLLLRPYTQAIYAQIDFPFKRRLRQTAVYQLLRESLVRAREVIRPTTGVADHPSTDVWFQSAAFYADPLPEPLRRGWERYLTHLERLIDKVERAGARFALLVIPDWHQVTNPEWRPVPQETLGTRAAERGVVLIDLLPTFRRLETPSASLYLDPETDGHLNAHGSDVAAAVVFAELDRRDWIRRCAP